MGVKITISGTDIKGKAKVLTGCDFKGGDVKVDIANSEIQGDSELLNGTSIKGPDARLEVALKQVNVGKGASMLNNMHVQGEVIVTASGVEVAKGATVMNGKIVGDGEKVVVDLNGSNKGGDETEVDNSHQKPKNRGLLDILFGKHKRQENEYGVGKKTHKASIKDEVSGNGKFRDPAYSNACTGDGSFQKPEKDKGQTR